MKKRLFAVLLIAVFTQVTIAQTVKTGVLVIGNGSNAVGAGFQSAISGVKTILLVQESDFVIAPVEKNLASGLEFNLLQKMRVAKGIKDSTTMPYIDGTSTNAVLKTWADSIKNLTVIRSVKWSRIKRSGNNWNVQLADGRTIKAEVLVNADGTGNVNSAITPVATIAEQWQPFQYKNNLYRTSLASGYAKNNATANVVLLPGLLVQGQENLVILNREDENLVLGQAGGAVAAYAVFFKTKTSLANLKTIQKELINYKLSAIPFADIPNTDRNWKPIQLVGLSGFLKASFVNGGANFMPDQAITVAEIKEPMKEYYYKAQIWFDDYKGQDMTIGAVLSLVSVVGNKSLENTTADVKKKWKSVYHFAGEFDPGRNINRREFSVLVDQYLNPFYINIDRTGRVIR